MRTVEINPFMDACRAAWKNSLAYRAMREGKPLSNSVSKALPREPGEDRAEIKEPALGIPLDPLEQEFLDRSEP